MRVDISSENVPVTSWTKNRLLAAFHIVNYENGYGVKSSLTSRLDFGEVPRWIASVMEYLAGAGFQFIGTYLNSLAWGNDATTKQKIMAVYWITCHAFDYISLTAYARKYNLPRFTAEISFTDFLEYRYISWGRADRGALYCQRSDKEPQSGWGRPLSRRRNSIRPGLPEDLTCQCWGNLEERRKRTDIIIRAAVRKMKTETGHEAGGRRGGSNGGSSRQGDAYYSSGSSDERDGNDQPPPRRSSRRWASVTTRLPVRFHQGTKGRP